MEPTNEQKEWLKEYLYQSMQYRETYEEVYDHILLAIEYEPQREFFETVVVNVIDKDFGGRDKLFELEYNCKEAASETAKTQYRSDLKQWFVSPRVIVPLTLFMLLFWFQQLKAVGLWVFLLYITFLLAPYVALALRGFVRGYKYSETKTSIRDEAARNIAFTVNRKLVRIYLYLIIASAILRYISLFQPLVHKTNATHSSGGHLIVLTLIAISSGLLVFLTMHILTVVKLYRSEFELSLR